MLLINNGKIMTMDNRTEFDRGFVLVDDTTEKGIIIAFGRGDGISELDEAVSVRDGNNKDRIILDANHGTILPGLIDPHCHIGLWQDGQRPDTGDGNEMTDPCTPHLRAIDAINPLDPCFKEAYEAGITSVMTGPGSANVLAGTFAFIKTFGSNIDKMTVCANAAMKAALGENPKGVYGPRNNVPGTRMGNAAVLREAMIKAKAYKEAKEKHAKDEKSPDPEFNFKHEALIPVLDKKMILKIHGHRADDLLTAVRICKEFDLMYTLDHCTEGYLVADDLLEAYEKDGLCGVMTGPLMSDRSKPELANQSIRNPGILSAKGIRTAILTDHPVIPVQYLAVTASVAAREGMDEYSALEAITCNAARLCGTDSRVGSITVGKDADIAVFSGHPFDFRTKTLYTVIDGKVRFSHNG